MPLGLFGGTRTDQLTGRDGATAVAMAEDHSRPLAGPTIGAIPDMNEAFGRLAAGSERAAEWA